MGKKKLILIAGGSGSGKTTLAEALYSKLGEAKAALVTFDEYYNPLTHLSLEERARVNFDHPDALDIPLLRSHILGLLAGESVEVPRYDFATHDRRADTRRVEPRSYVIVEGILALHDPELRDAALLKIFVETPEEERYRRRLERDVRERGRTAASVKEQWDTTVSPMFKEFCESSSKYADLRVVGEHNLSLLIEQAIDTLKGN